MRSRSLLLVIGTLATLATCNIAKTSFVDAPPDDMTVVVVPEDCNTAGDEDHNGLADCADPACAGLARCLCGNGKIDPGEMCDPPDPMKCSPDCTMAFVCGNGMVEAGEECDDGNASNNDDCRNDCVKNRCGDGFVNTTGTTKEACDGAPPAAPGVKTLKPTNTATCNSTCTIPSCGDSFVNPAFIPAGSTVGENCDRGAANADDTDCTHLCRANVCGDGHVDLLGPAHFEQCDDGNQVNGDTCDTNCTPPSCGNGALDPGEICDDGNPSCGACATNCATVTSAKATGSITSSKGSEYVASDSFTLNDGLGGVVKFTFTAGTPGANQIKFDAAATNADMAARIVTAINAAAGLLITATASPTAGVVALSHDQPTSNGNQAVVEQVAATTFLVAGMTGGLGGNCGSGQTCAQGIDCLSQVCTAGRCR